MNRCERCRRRLRKSHDGWNAITKNGAILGFLCPSCQTPEENAEAEVNESTLNYSMRPDGRVVGQPKAATG